MTTPPAYKKPFNVTPSQVALTSLIWHDEQVTDLLAYGPARSGKSAIIMLNIINRALTFPGTKHAVFRATIRDCRAHLFNGTFVDMMRQFYPDLYEHLQNTSGINKSESRVTFHNGSEIVFDGLDPNNLERILGPQYATAWINECNQITDYTVVDALSSRMVDSMPMVGPDGQVVMENGEPRMVRPLMIYDCNPDLKSDWDYIQFVDKRYPGNGAEIPRHLKLNYRRVFMPAKERAETDKIVANYLDNLAGKYEGSPAMAERFLVGEWRDDNPDAMFRKSMFIYQDMPRLDWLTRILVAIDPSGSAGNNSDYTGIVVVGLGLDGRAYVLEDASEKVLPEVWGETAVKLYDKWGADLIIAERNYGGAMVEATIRAARRNVPVKTIWASRGKIIRAEPVSFLYKDKRVIHTSHFKELEAQMCDYRPETKKSPDRMDALVWGLTELMDLNGDANFSTPGAVIARRGNRR